MLNKNFQMKFLEYEMKLNSCGKRNKDNISKILLLDIIYPLININNVK